MDAEVKLLEIQMKEREKLSLLSATAAKIRGWSQHTEMLTPEHIVDPYMRERLIDATEKMEKFLENGKIMLQTEIETSVIHGLTIRCMVDKPIENKPSITYFTYSMDTEKLKVWLEEHKYLEGPLSVMCRGIKITYPEREVKPQSYHKTMFTIETEETDDNALGLIFMDLMIKEAIFAVHRDIFSGKEWIVSRMA